MPEARGTESSAEKRGHRPVTTEMWFSIFKYPHDVNACNPVYHEGLVFFANGYGIGSHGLKID